MASVSQKDRGRIALTTTLLTAALLVGISSCSSGESDDAPDVRLQFRGFMLVDSELAGLNGSENDGRPPIHFGLLRFSSTGTNTSEQALVSEYVRQLTGAGSKVVEHAEPDDWWTWQGRGPDGLIRVGPAERFFEHARAAEGYAPVKFRQRSETISVPLVVVSIDTGG